MATTPNYGFTGRADTVDVTTANTAVDGSGTLATVLTAGASGTRVDSIQIKGRLAVGATQAADTVRLFIHNGSTARLLKEQLVPAGAGPISVTVANFEATVPLGILIPATFSIRATTSVGGTTGIYVLTAFGADL